MNDESPDLPTADITALRTAVRDGWYNAFTDLALWKDMYWLCYRRGTNHAAGNSVEVVLRSDDLRRWRQVIDFESPAGIADGCAAADGHFCTTPDRLYLFIGTRNPIHSYVSWTDDGVHWSQPALLVLGDDHPYTWRVRWREGLFYSAILPSFATKPRKAISTWPKSRYRKFPVRPERRTPTERSSYTRSASIRRMSSMPYSIMARRSKPTPRPTAVNRFESYPSASIKSAFILPNPAIELHSMPCS